MADQADQWDVDDQDDDDAPDARLEFEILNYPADTTLSGYLQQWNDGKLEVPPFQRNYVWDANKASRLIESFLIGLPVPGVFLYKKRETSTFQIIDGLQRISSVVSFQKGILNDKKFRLKGISEEWNGLSYDELPEKDQFKLQQSVMRSTVIQQLDPMDDSSIYMIFERLNTGGVNLNPMEVRRCVYHGSFIDELDRLNQDENWRRCLSKPKIDNRYRDVELLLKVLAFYEDRDHYDKPAKHFLNKYLVRRRNDDNFKELSEKFSAACAAVIDALGNRPFHLRGRLSQAAMDSILSSIMILGSKPKKEQFEDLFNDDSFIQGTTRNTSDNLEVGLRLQAAMKYLG